MKQTSVLVATVIAITSTVGCDQSTVTTRFDSPQDAYAAFAAATQVNDWGTAAKALQADSQAMMAVSMIMGASIMAGSDETLSSNLESLLAKHGIDLDADPEPPQDIENYDPQAERLRMVEPVKNIPAFLDEIGQFMKDTGKESPGGMAEMGELGTVKIDGDTAYATCETDDGPQPIGFIKSDEGWLLDLMVDERNAADDSNESDRDGPALGMISYGDQEIALRHALAYQSKFFDDPCIDVLLTAKPIYERGLKRLKRLLKEQGNGMGFFPDGPNIRLSIDHDGKLLDVFAWIDNVSLGLTPDTKIDVQLVPNRIHGTAQLTAPRQIGERDQAIMFEATFDVEMINFD